MLKECVIDARGLSRPQRDFFLCDEAHPAFIGGFGSGKTHVAVLKAIKLSMINLGLPGAFVEPTFPHVRKVALPMFRQLLRKTGIPYDYNKNEHLLTLMPWGRGGPESEIWLYSGHDPEAIRGPTLAWAGIDEIAQMKPEIWGELVGRVRHNAASLRQTFATGTPDEYWVAELWEDNPKPGYVMFRSTPYDNPAISDEYIANLVGSWSEEDLERVVWGRFVRGGRGRSYKAFDRHTHVRDTSPFDPEGRQTLIEGLPLCLACDFNVDPCVWLLIQHRGGYIYVLDEIVGHDTNTPDMADQLRAKTRYAKHRPFYVYGDPSGRARSTTASRSDYEIIRSAGFALQRVARQAPPVRDRVLAVNARLRSGDKTARLFVHSRCRMLIRDFEWVKWRKGSNREIDKTNKERTHASDALGYFVYREYPVKRPALKGVRVADII